MLIKHTDFLNPFEKMELIISRNIIDIHSFRTKIKDASKFQEKKSNALVIIL